MIKGDKVKQIKSAELERNRKIQNKNKVITEQDCKNHKGLKTTKTIVHVSKQLGV